MSRPKGKTRVLTPDQFHHALEQLKSHRYPQKNKAILLLSFTMGLTAQEIARLRLQDVAEINANDKTQSLRDHIAVYPKQQATRHDIAMRENHKGYNIEKAQLDAIIRRVEAAVLNGQPVAPSDYYPQKQTYQRALRILPLCDAHLRASLTAYLEIRLNQVTRSDYRKLAEEPFILNQKRGAYSANTLQEHMKLMLAVWADIPGATSLSGRTTLVNNMLNAGVAMRTIQYFFGHGSASTTVLHTAPNATGNYLTYDLRSLHPIPYQQETIS